MPAQSNAMLSVAVVIPVKPLGLGKTRLSQDRQQRALLGQSFAEDTLAAVTATPGVAGVIVVTDDSRFATRVAGAARVIPDGVIGNLNANLVQGAAEAVRLWPDALPVALCADLPAVLPEHLTAAFAQLDRTGPWFVRDAEGTGSTMYAAPRDQFDPAFGVDSATAHQVSGALEISGELAGLRQDVDSPLDLHAAVALGVGPATRRAVGLEA